MIKPTPQRQLVVGLDAMEWFLVKKWAAEGKLPTFRRLLDQGSHARLDSPARALPDTSWPALCTGVNPGKLGKYFYVQYDPMMARLRYMTDDEVRAVPFWDTLDEAGVRVGVIEVPHMPPTPLVHGFRLTDWGSHDNVHRPWASPASLKSEVLTRFGTHPVEDCEKFNSNARSRRALRDQLVQGVRAHGQLFRWLLGTQAWDVFMCVFAAPHCAGHHFWSAMDPEHPDHAAGRRDGLTSAIQDVYRAIDGEIALMLEGVDDRTRVLLVSGHGMGPLYHASWSLNQILELLGFSDGTLTTRPVGSRTAAVNPWRVLKMLAPSRLQYWIKERLPKSLQDYLLFLWYAGGRTYGKRRVFAVPNNDVAGAIRISLQGRDPDGLVLPGEYDALCDAVAVALGALTDPVSGRPIIKEVIRMRREFHGPFAGQLPDLCVLWNRDFPWRAIQSPRFGVLHLPRMDSRTGSHNRYGFLIATGPGIPAGVELSGYSTYDIVPTLLAGAGVAVPPGLDGKPIPIDAADPK